MNTNTTQVSTNGDREEFIRQEILMLVTLGALASRSGRNPTYRKKQVDEKQVEFDNAKEEFRKCLKKRLEGYGKEYRYCNVKEEDHEKNIESLASIMSHCHGGILKDGRFRIGSAQKALNLYLKYLWCLGKIDMPPHCPIDGVILEYLKCDDKWTELDCIKKYRHIIKKAKERAGAHPLACWELTTFNQQR